MPDAIFGQNQADFWLKLHVITALFSVSKLLDEGPVSCFPDSSRRYSGSRLIRSMARPNAAF